MAVELLVTCQLYLILKIWPRKKAEKVEKNVNFFMPSKLSDQKRWNSFVSDYLSKLLDNHERIAEKKDFQKMCQKYGKAWIDYLNASFTAYEATKEFNVMSWEQFVDYNGIPDYYIPNLKYIEQNNYV